ncbi:MarR family winged helix-turn-helix transcriptional regulator [Mucilaginibacter terrae]|uniref:DNA-binding MarR family transcriptional regulator n=1 Tax=Mucilaginibacter terrae TaxID=1955052 RepID=A0ABU3GQ32_9SPHI|nr:MarR family transcriptional regulator [Mucilaginibacter terrae]MDT3401895.1 DNA-binding MarR family transcriptional regulator [Mucilaginibacter terrae]
MKKCDINTDLLLFRIFHIHKIICNKANKLFSKDGVHIQVEQIPVLMVVHHLGPQSQQDIAHELLRDKSSVLRTVGSLQTAGYLKVEHDTIDKRKKLVKLAPQGAWLAEKIASEVGDMDSKMFSNLSVAEKLILTELLEKCAEHINTME